LGGEGAGQDGGFPGLEGGLFRLHLGAATAFFDPGDLRGLCGGVFDLDGEGLGLELVTTIALAEVVENFAQA
jgi:hypothetical protein